MLTATLHSIDNVSLHVRAMSCLTIGMCVYLMWCVCWYNTVHQNWFKLHWIKIWKTYWSCLATGQ